MRQRPACVSALLSFLLLCGVVAAAVPSPETPQVLTEVEIVQRFAAGASIEELIDLIARSRVDFDTSPETLDELRQAGLPQRVLRAMTRRQELMDAPLDLKEGARVTVSFNPDVQNPDKRFVRLNEKIDKRLIQAWHLELLQRRQQIELRFEDIALFIACANAEHAPQNWRKWTPLTDRFAPVPRHKLLAVAPGAKWALPGFWRRWGIRPSLASAAQGGEEGAVGMASLEPRSGTLGILELRIPDVLEAWLEPDAAHDLMVGIAVKIGNGYHVWQTARHGLRLGEDDEAHLEARISGTGGKKLQGYGIELTRVAVTGGNGE